MTMEEMWNRYQEILLSVWETNDMKDIVVLIAKQAFETGWKLRDIK